MMMMMMIKNNNHVASATGALYWSDVNSVIECSLMTLTATAGVRSTGRPRGVQGYAGGLQPRQRRRLRRHGVAATLFESESSNYCAPEFTCFTAVIAHTVQRYSSQPHMLDPTLPSFYLHCIVAWYHMMVDWILLPTNAGETFYYLLRVDGGRSYHHHHHFIFRRSLRSNSTI